MIDTSFASQYAAAVNNLLHPVDQESEEQVAAALAVVDKIKKLRKEIYESMLEVDQLGRRYSIQKLALADGDPLANAIQEFNKKVELIQDLRETQELVLSDLKGVYFPSKWFRAMQDVVAEARDQVDKAAKALGIIFYDLDEQLKNARAALSRLGVPPHEAGLEKCSAELGRVKELLDGSLGAVSLGDAAEFLRSPEMIKLKTHFDGLAKQVREAEDRHNEKAREERERIRLAQQEEADRREREEAERERKRKENLRKAEEKARLEWEAAEREKQAAFEQRRLREKAERERAKAEKARMKVEQERALVVARFQSLSNDTLLIVHLLALISGIAAVYFLLSNLPAFDAAFICAAVYVLVGSIEAQITVRAMEQGKAAPRLWWEIQIDDPIILVYLLASMLIQLVGGVVYSTWDWFSPISSSWVGFIFPHTIEDALWFLLVAPICVVCLAPVPMSFLNFIVYLHAKRALKGYS